MDSLKRSFGGLLTVEMFLKKQRYLKTYKHTLNWTKWEKICCKTVCNEKETIRDYNEKLRRQKSKY